MLPLLAIWLLVSLVIGFLAGAKSIGFWGGFFGSIALSPLVGLVIVFVSAPAKMPRYSSTETRRSAAR